ncbi:haloacid dehalogenase [Primorskyibacter flagellatus]|uniref:(S)-2-haloacid dehalogenase n=1 Tax=Primorskyibacter flagellatus TaxID=1387277 RepID=A0A917EI34_9RHOB|nr:haloacid dehalogenase type II [Primorskyibacter flagellatus]GGE45241.1 haloacid dehalogenase [Primorskyibacter flagellatus]
MIRPDHKLAFDVYGTLVDPHGLVGHLGSLGSTDGAGVSALWRQLQLDFSFRRALMRDWVPFAEITRQALRTAWAYTEPAPLPRGAEDAILTAYLSLPAFDDAVDALRALRSAGLSCHAFSNGDPDDLDVLLRASGLGNLLNTVVSAAPVRSFKPDPQVYAHCLARIGSPPDRTWLVSGNPFDILGAARAGWNTLWVQRDPARPFDAWGISPTLTVASLADIRQHVGQPDRIRPDVGDPT